MFSWLWLVLASFAALGAVAYNTAVRVAAETINPFLFTMMITSVAFAGHIAAFLVYRYGYNGHDLLFSTKGAWAALVAGLAIVVIDLAFFFAVKLGGLAISSGVWVVGGTVMTTMVSFYVFKEDLDIYKISGLTLGIAGLLLLLKPS